MKDPFSDFTNDELLSLLTGIRSYRLDYESETVEVGDPVYMSIIGAEERMVDIWKLRSKINASRT